MYKLVLIRHGESTWNKENRFTGWHDVELSDKGRAEAKAAGIGAFAYGSFITALINFLIMAFVIFMIVRQANKMMAPAPGEAPATPEDVVLLREIRDSLKK